MKEISKPKKKKKLGKSYNWQFWAIIALPMIYAFVFAYIPMGGIIVAFQKYSPRKGILGSEWVGLKYFKQFFTTPSSRKIIFNTFKKFWTGFRNSLFYMVFGTFINIVMTLLCAYPLSRKEFTARNKVAMFFVFTMYFSGGMVPSFMLVNALGLVDTIWAMLIPGAMSTYNMIIARTYMINSIPDELYEAAEIDGCTPFKYLIRIVVPLSKPIIAVLVLYYGVARWNSYQDAILYLQKANYLQPLQIILREILIMNDIDETMMGNADALARQRGLKDLLQYSVIVIASVPVMIIYPFVQKYFVKGVMIGAVKG